MPVRGASAKRYAQAAFEIAVERDAFDAWARDLADLAEALAEPQLAALLGNPRIPVSAKRQMLRDAMPEAADEAINLATLLIIKSRLEALAGPIAEAYRRLLDEHRGILQVEVVTAVELETAQREGMIRQLAEATGKEVRLTPRVDEGLVGGMVIRVGDQVLDGSVRSKLRGLRRSLVSGGI